MSFAAALETWDAAVRARERYAIWGHLEPSPNKYPGWILFAHGYYGDLVVLDTHFTDIDDCPGFCEDLQEFIGAKAEAQQGIYRFDGYYQRFKNGNGRFCGTVKKCAIPPPQA